MTVGSAPVTSSPAGPALGARAGRRVGPVLALVLLAVLAMGPAPAGAQEEAVSGPEAAALARDAVSDDDALERLRAVSTVDGRAVDLDAATADLGVDRADRLEALATVLGPASGGDPDAAGPAPTADDARGRADEVLDDDKFRTRDVPRPFRAPLEWLADRLRPIGRAADRVFGPAVRWILDLPGGPAILAAVLVGATAALTGWLISRRSRSTHRSDEAGRLLVDASLDPDEMERQAEAAEADGDRTLAVRLRYEAGLIRLVRAGRVELRPQTTASDAARQVGDPTMSQLTADFEEIVYGGRAATADDVVAARSGWPELLGVRTRR